MLEQTELLLFIVVTGFYIVAWGLYWMGWKKRNELQISRAHWVLWGGFILHFILNGMRSMIASNHRYFSIKKHLT